MTETSLILDRAHGLIHRRDCPALLLEPAEELQPFVGLERGLEGGNLALCTCAHSMLLLALSRFLAGAADAFPEAPRLGTLAGDLERLADVFRGVWFERLRGVAARVDADGKH